MVADPHENRRPRNLTAADMAAQFRSGTTDERPARRRFNFPQLRRSVSAPKLNNVAATYAGNALASLLWRWPAAMWNRFWTATQNSGLRWVVFAPWILAVVTPVALEILQDVASWVPPESTSGFETVPLFPVIPATTAMLTAHIDAVLLHFTGLEAFLCWPLLAIVFAYVGTGPIHVMGASGRAPALDSHGSAAWGTSSDAIQGGHLLPQGTREGLMLGHVELPKGEKKKRDPRYRVFSHVLTFAGTGRGKGIGAAIPNLLVYPGSTFSVDPKAEQYEVTARARLDLGFEIARLDPFCGTGKPSHSFNWLDAIDPDHKSCVAESAQLADAIVVRAGKDPHWDRQATYLLQGLILHVATLPQQERHMGTVRDLLMLGTDDLRTLLGTLAEDKTRGCGLIAKTGKSFLGKVTLPRFGGHPA